MKNLRSKRITAVVILGALFFALAGIWWRAAYRQQVHLEVRSVPEISSAQIAQTSMRDLATVAIAENLDTPWATAFLPNGDILVTERPGILRQIGANSHEIGVPDVVESGEGGLMGLALHPDFSQNHQVYLYFTGQNSNRVKRFVFDGGNLTNEKVIIDNIPASAVHDGGALAFGPDGKLYVTTGDANVPQNAQNIESLSGKILRLNDDGSVPADNPFANAIWSYGHRNPQGIAWDSRGQMWEVEHGPSGASTGYDEVNLIEKGANYGWPTITGDRTADGMKSPAIQSGGNETWAPSGLAYADGVLYFAGLRGQTLYKATINNDNSLTLSRHLTGEYGRLRAANYHDGYLYISTSNRDGRGNPSAGDDRVWRIAPETLR